MKKYRIEAIITDADDESDCDDIMDYAIDQLSYDMENVHVQHVEEITNDEQNGESVSSVEKDACGGY